MWTILSKFILRLDIAIISIYPPVDDAIPERPPQARLTMTVGSLGLNVKEIAN